MSASYIPDAGDLIWLTFDPQVGREQAGRRPALVLSPRNYNGKSSLALACPITSHAKGYPFEVPITTTAGPTGVILADQVKSVDWKVRRAENIGPCPMETLEEVRAKLGSLLGF